MQTPRDQRGAAGSRLNIGMSCDSTSASPRVIARIVVVTANAPSFESVAVQRHGHRPFVRRPRCRVTLPDGRAAWTPSLDPACQLAAQAAAAAALGAPDDGDAAVGRVRVELGGRTWSAFARSQVPDGGVR